MWTYDLNLTASDFVATVRDETGAIICQCEGEHAEARAARIVKCVSAHEDLVAMLRQCASVLFAEAQLSNSNDMKSMALEINTFLARAEAP